MKQEVIQLSFLLATFIAISFIEAKFNRVDLRISYKRRGWLMEVSQIAIYMGGILLCLLSVRVLPNYFQCSQDDICTCKLKINKRDHGCGK